ncbi:MAG: hypothetical protein LC745_07415 [Planctomycetia bacterium]|nr:hypothetical protein [Planctomycetia bacterium]
MIRRWTCPAPDCGLSFPMPKPYCCPNCHRVLERPEPSEALRESIPRQSAEAATHNPC